MENVTLLETLIVTVSLVAITIVLAFAVRWLGKRDYEKFMLKRVKEEVAWQEERRKKYGKCLKCGTDCILVPITVRIGDKLRHGDKYWCQKCNKGE